MSFSKAKKYITSKFQLPKLAQKRSQLSKDKYIAKDKFPAYEKKSQRSTQIPQESLNQFKCPKAQNKLNNQYYQKKQKKQTHVIQKTKFKKNAFPMMLKSALRQKAKSSIIENGPYQIQLLTCQICLGKIKKQDLFKLCDCEHQYCRQCLNKFILYKVRVFQQIQCPNDNCTKKMQKEGYLFKCLPVDIKNKYQKIVLYHEVIKNPNLRACPKQNCQGILEISQKYNFTICDKCKIKYCSKCFFKFHESLCNQNIYDFLYSLNYRQCYNCKNMIQKFQGCNHMTCRCKYEFCFRCQKKWTSNHQCSIQARPPMQRVIQPRRQNRSEPQAIILPRRQNNQQQPSRQRQVDISWFQNNTKCVKTTKVLISLLGLVLFPVLISIFLLQFGLLIIPTIVIGTFNLINQIKRQFDKGHKLLFFCTLILSLVFPFSAYLYGFKIVWQNQTVYECLIQAPSNIISLYLQTIKF